MVLVLQSGVHAATATVCMGADIRFLHAAVSCGGGGGGRPWWAARWRIDTQQVAFSRMGDKTALAECLKCRHGELVTVQVADIRLEYGGVPSCLHGNLRYMPASCAV